MFPKFINLEPLMLNEPPGNAFSLMVPAPPISGVAVSPLEVYQMSFPS